MVKNLIGIAAKLPVNLVSLGLSALQIALLLYLRSEPKENNTMQIILTQKEIETALVDFVGGQGIPLQGKHINVDLIAGKELSASISVSGESKAQPAATATAEPEPTPVFATPEPTTSEPDDDNVDRDKLKAILDTNGIFYAPKARTATLVTLVDEIDDSAKAEDTPAESPAKPTTNIFAPEAQDDPPFNLKDASVEEDAPVDDDKPLFGN